MPGEIASKTQPIPSRPAPFDRQGLGVDDLIDFTEELRAEAKAIIAPFVHGPLFTPPSLQGTINLPGWGGGGNWSGAAFDPQTQLYYVPSMTNITVAQLRQGDPDETNFRYVRSRAVTRLAGPRGLPLTKPPYARITAIDLATGEHRWMVPHGDGPRQKVIDLGAPDPGPLGSLGISPPLLTPTLLFLAQTDNDRHVLRAFDKAGGEIIAEIELPAAPSGAPMTYLAHGRQYIVLAAGLAADASLIAVSLPAD